MESLNITPELARAVAVKVAADTTLTRTELMVYFANIAATHWDMLEAGMEGEPASEQADMIFRLLG